MKITLNTLLLFAIPMAVFANSNSTTARVDYIEQFSEFAITEMQRSGVPASITLAQGLVESNAGQSELSRKSLNHFGIKCKKSWQGKTVYYKDDDYKNGKLIESCFRAYNSVLESYTDHSNFLRKNPRYSKLFDLHPTDYQGWAIGLKECGYATNKKYADMLIKIIEDYALYIYDIPKKDIIESPIYSVSTPIQPTTEPTDNQETALSAIVLEAPTYQISVPKKRKQQKRKKRFNQKTIALQVRPVHRPIAHSIGTR